MSGAETIRPKQMNELFTAMRFAFKDFKGDKGDPMTFEGLNDAQKAELRGKDGAKPVRGIDYFTEKDKQMFLTAVKKLIKVPVKGKDYFTLNDRKEFMEQIDHAFNTKGKDYFKKSDIKALKAEMKEIARNNSTVIKTFVQKESASSVKELLNNPELIARALEKIKPSTNPKEDKRLDARAIKNLPRNGGQAGSSPSSGLSGAGVLGKLAIWSGASSLSYNDGIYAENGNLVADNFQLDANGAIFFDHQGDNFGWIRYDVDGNYGYGARQMIFSTPGFVDGGSGNSGFVFQNGEDGSSRISITFVNSNVSGSGKYIWRTNTGADQDSYTLFSSEYNRNYFRYDDDNAFLLLNEGGGYVGVNTTNPQVNFHVEGYFRANGIGVGRNPDGGALVQLQGTGNLQQWSYSGLSGNTWSLNISSGGSYILTPSDANDAFFIDFSDANKMLQIDNRGVMVGLSAGLWVGQGFDIRLSRSSAGVFSIDNGTAGTYRDLIMRNLTARVVPRVGTATSSGTPTINTDNVDYYQLTAQAANITSMTTNLSGTPNNGQKLWLSIVGTGTFDITWGTGWESGSITLPTTGAITTTRLDLGFVWNAITSKWRIIALS